MASIAAHQMASFSAANSAGGTPTSAALAMILSSMSVMFET